MVLRPRPMLQLAVGLALGISLTEWFALPVAPPLMLGLTSLIVGLSAPAWAWLAGGIAVGALRYDLWREPPPALLPPSRVVLRAVGTLEPTRNGYRLLCAIEQPKCEGFVLVYFRPQVRHLPDYGDLFRAELSWRRPPRFARFNWALYLERRRVYFIATVFSHRQFEILHSGMGQWQRRFSEARHSLRQTLRAHLSPDSAALIEGMLVGATGDFPPALREAFHRAGTGHLLATSGLHVAILLHAVYLALRWTPVPYGGRMGIVILAAWLYALLAGLRPSIVRAAAMATAVLSAPIVGREADSLNALGLAATIWLLVAPYAIFEVGFQYSFCAVLFILLFHARLEGVLCRMVPRKMPLALACLLQKGVIPLLSITLCAQVGISVVQLYHFGYLSLLSPVANLLSVPLAYPTLVAGFWLWLSQGVGSVLVEWLSEWHKSIALVFGQPALPALRVEHLPAWAAIACYASVLLLAPEPPVRVPEETP